MKTRLRDAIEAKEIYDNTKNLVIMRERQFVLKHFSSIAIRKLASLISIREVENKIIKSDEYVVAKLSFDKLLNDKSTIAILFYESSSYR